MAIRLPQQLVEFNDIGAIGAQSVAGGIPHVFSIPQDTDAITVKVTGSVAGAGVSVVLQTTDDGGTTWYDVGRTSVITNTAGNANATWTAGFVAAGGMATAINAFPASSILSVGIANTSASTLAANQVSGLPLLSQLARTFTIVGAAATGVASVKTQVKVQSQSATA